jgi:hypothetical protein
MLRLLRVELLMWCLTLASACFADWWREQLYNMLMLRSASNRARPSHIYSSEADAGRWAADISASDSKPLFYSAQDFENNQRVRKPGS